MLHKKVRASNLALQALFSRSTVRAHVLGVVLTHVVFQRFAVRLRRWLPSRLLRVWVEVIRQVFAIRMSDFPARRQACSLVSGQRISSVGGFAGPREPFHNRLTMMTLGRVWGKALLVSSRRIN